jgi:hypothetical protein
MANWNLASKKVKTRAETLWFGHRYSVTKAADRAEAGICTNRECANWLVRNGRPTLAARRSPCVLCECLARAAVTV